jgi:stage II sporulation protein AA (anti-sigma F factor antagonist)
MQFIKDESYKDSMPSTIIYRCGGEIALTRNFEGLKTDIQEEIRDGRQIVLLNMGEVYYVNSTGIGLLMKIHKMVEAKNARLIFCNFQPQISKVFLEMKLFNAFRYFPSEQHILIQLKLIEPPAAPPMEEKQDEEDEQESEEEKMVQVDIEE